MCSIFKYRNTVGRNFDYEVSYQEELRIVERNEFSNDYRIIGMVTGAVKDYPLFYDGMNECGLVCGGLAFTGNAVYSKHSDWLIDEGEIPSYDFIFWVLSKFKSVDSVKHYLEYITITDKPYSDEMPPSDLHWFIADENESIIVEQTSDGLDWYDGEVMTNNPPYPTQWGLCDNGIRNIKGKYPFGAIDTRGTETYKLSGDYTSTGRFERLTYLKNKLESSENSFNPVSQAFHLCSSVEQIYGATPVDDKYEYTIYSVVYDMENKEVYLRFYDDVLYFNYWRMDGFKIGDNDE